METNDVISAADRLVAHRGYPRHYPENSLVGIEAAIRVGAKYIEVDVQLSRDQVALLFHDRNLQRLCGKSGAPHDYAWSELKTFRPSEAQRFGDTFKDVRIPKLEQFGELLRSHPQVTAFIELKRISLAQFGEAKMIAQVMKSLQPVLSQCVIISYSLSALEKVRALVRQPIGVIADDWHALSHQQVQALEAEYLLCDIESLPDEDELHVPGSRLVVYECTDADKARTVLARGVGLVETFAIGEMLASLQAEAEA